ncbi:MAG: amino acid decarboxylase, partial [Clostridia bacterium]|nr:amino acid decarboxylase [Clostridia bacterium]
SKCEGRVLASDTTGCPPAVPIAVCGERLTSETIALCGYYGAKELRVVRD